MSALEVVMMKRIGELKAEIEALQAEVVRLKIYDVEHWQDQWLLVVEDNNKLRAEVERLRKAGDLLAFHYISLGRKFFPNDPLPPSITEWNAVKEGRPNE